MAQIKKDTSLRKAILQAAVTGKLISTVVEPAETTIETGRQLLDRIIEERNKKVLEETKKNHTDLQISTKSAGKKSDSRSKSQIRVIKKELPPITEEEIPFEIPENWCWCRLGDLISISSGDMLTSAKMINGTIPVYGGNGITGYHNVANVHEETIVIGRVGFYCGSVHLTEKEAWVTDNAFITTYSKNYLNREYLMTALEQLDLGKQQNKTAQPVVSGKKIYSILVPLPPLAVQNAIVAKLEQVLPQVDAYENAVFRKEELKGALKDKVKKAVLQEAIQGRLVPTLNTSFGLPGKDPSGPQADTAKTRGIDLQTGTELLEQIRAEKKKLIREGKLKKEKPLPEITEDEIPFNVPENWCWCRLGEIVELTSGQDLPPSSYNNKNIGIPYLTGASNFSNESIIINRWTETPKAIALKNDLLLTCKGTVGEMAFLTEEKVHIARQIMSLRTDENISLKYIKCFLYSQIEILKSKAKSMIPGIAREDIIMLVMPLPPLAEQKRIVAAIEELLPLCEKLGE